MQAKSCYNIYMSSDFIFLEIIFLVMMFILGAIFGSFACCQAWRIYYKEEKKKDLGKWSVCLKCKKRLSPIENIPIISWLIQKGKCKKCGAKIGVLELLSEIGLALSFTALGASLWPEIINAGNNILQLSFELITTLLIIVIVTMMWILLIYDAKWKLLPTKLLGIVNILAVICLGIRLASFSLAGTFWQDFTAFLPGFGIGILLLPGIYYLLYKMSDEKLVGSGDWLLALAISLILGNWWLCLLALFLSNFMASIVGIILKTRKGEKTIPFGPFLVLAFIVIYALQNWLSILFAGLV